MSQETFQSPNQAQKSSNETFPILFSLQFFMCQQFNISKQRRKLSQRNKNLHTKKCCRGEDFNKTFYFKENPILLNCLNLITIGKTFNQENWRSFSPSKRNFASKQFPQYCCKLNFRKRHRKNFFRFIFIC